MSIAGLGCAIVSVSPDFAKPKWRAFHACMFVGTGLSSIVAVVHGCITYGPAQFNRQMRYEWMIYEGIQYTLGAGLHAVRHVLADQEGCNSDYCNRHPFENDSFQENSIYGALPARYSMSLS